MAKKKKSEDGTTNKVMWVAGTAAVTAFAMYYVNRHLNEREELNRLRYAEERKRLESGGGSEE
jgi:hypothetical protein